MGGSTEHVGDDDLPLLLIEVDESTGAALDWDPVARQAWALPPLNASSGATPEASWACLLPSPLQQARLLACLTDPDSADGVELVEGDRALRFQRLAGTRHVVVSLAVDRAAQRQQLDDRCRQLQRLLTLSRQDRQLIAYEVHDSLVQEMTAALMFLEAAAAGVEDTETAETMAKSGACLRRAIEDARRLINGLQPPELEAATFADAVSALIDARPQLECDAKLEHNDPLAGLDPTLGVCLFRIVQESLSNIWKHSGAAQATIRWERAEDELTLEISDNGAGFDVEQAVGGRIGLQSMQHRAVAFGGSFEVESEPGQGTRIRVRLPLVFANPETP